MNVRTIGRLAPVALLVLTTLSLPTASAGPKDHPADSWSGSTTARVAGFLVPGTPASRTLVASTMVLSATEQRLRGSVTLGAPTAAGEETRVVVSPGYLNGGTCADDPLTFVVASSRIPSAGVVFAGATVTFDVPAEFVDPAGYYDCLLTQVYVATPDGAGTATEEVDAAYGALVETSLLPVLRVRTPGEIKLVKGVKTAVYVTVTNDAAAPALAPGVTLTGSAPGVRVSRAESDDDLAPGESATFRLMLLRTGKKDSRVTFTATTPDVSGSTTAKVRAIRRPAPPAVGTYRGSRISFEVVAKRAERVITNLKARPRKLCLNAPVDIDRGVRIPANNVVDTTVTDAILSSYVLYNDVQMTFTGKKVTGYVNEYYDDISCVMELDFTARRR